MLLGAKTGRDGIGGVSVLASSTFEDDGGPAKRPSVQVGDPFTEKIVTECSLALFDEGLDDVERRTPIGFSEAGDSLVLLGDTRGGSAWAWVAHRHLGRNPPPVDLERERLLGEVLVAGSRDGMLSAAHDLSDGGLPLALVKLCLRLGHGARVVLPEGVDPFVALFSESAGRAVVAVRARRSCGSSTCARRGGCPGCASASSTRTSWMPRSTCRTC